MIWSFGSFEVDGEHYELRRAGSVVELRRKVFDVLHYLVRHSDRLVPKEELLRNVWAGENIHEGVIPQNIAILRRVLGDSREQAGVIQTVHGRGYRFVAKVTVHPDGRLDVRDSARRPSWPPSVSFAPPALPFVGRARVMDELRALLTEAGSGKGRFVFVSGEAGIGKTRLATELAAEAQAIGARVLEGRCHEGEGAPAYWPWVQILRAAAGGHASSEHDDFDAPGADAAYLVSELRGQFGEPQRPQPLDAAQARFRLFDGITSFLSRLARAQPLVLVLDDLHWADEATLHLLQFVAREVRALPLLVLGTSREVDARSQSQSDLLLSALAGGAHVRRIYLHGLSQADTSELVAATLERDLGDATLRELHALTEGNPFFVEEVLRLIAGEGEESSEGGSERWRLELPSRVREVIGLRLRALGAEAQRVLALASVIGREFRLAVLEPIAAVPRAQLAVLEQAERARIVRAVEGERGAEPVVSELATSSGRYRFAHALIRESLYAALSEPERVRLHDEVGRALEALLGVDAQAHLSELAHHFYRAASYGDVARAVDYCSRAGAQALELLAFEQAVLHYRRALDALASKLPVDELRRFELKLALGTAQFHAREDGNPALLGAAEIARRLERTDLLGRTVLAMRGWPEQARHGRTVNRQLRPLLAEALASPLDDAQALRARLLALLALNSRRQTPFAERVTISRQALELARSSGDDEALYDALHARLTLMQTPEDTARRLGLASELLTVAERLGQNERVFGAHELRVQPLLALGDLAAADLEIEHCAELAAELRLPRCRLQVLRLRLQRALGDGRFAEIKPLTDEAVLVRGQAEASPLYMVGMFVWMLFTQAWRYDRAWLESTLPGLAADADRATLMRAHVAYLYALLGKHDEARACYQPLLAPDVLDHERDDNWLTTLVLAADAAAACGDRDAAATLYPCLLPHAALNATHLEMLVYFGCCSHWLGQLAALLGERVRAAEHYETALEMNANLGAKPALARTSLEYARFLLARDPAGAEARIAVASSAVHQARALLREATALAESVGLAGVLREARQLAD